MVGLWRIGVLPAALVALVLVSTAQAQAEGSVDFKFYPKDAQDCLYKAAKSSKCESGGVPATNACLCRNGGDFITTAAACVGRSSRSNLEEVYRVMKGACSDSKTPISVTEDEWNEAAKGETSTTTSSTGTATTTPPPTPTGDDEKEEEASTGLSTGAMAGVIAGAIGGCAVLAAVGYLLFRRRRKLGEESHPMLPQQHPYAHHHVSMAPTGRESTAYYGSPPTTAGWPKKDWGGSPDFRQSGGTFNWESPAHLSYAGGALAPSPPLPIQELDSAPHYPSGSTEAPVEMGGTPVAATPPPPQPQPHHPPPANPQYQPYQAWSSQQR
jgi:LPXTG-motif cell wall-anchored protein